MSGPVSASVRKPVPKRTGKRMWSRQYDGRTISAALMLRPVTFESRRMLGAEKVILLGHSYGTQLAQEYARRHPAAVERLID